MYKDYPKFDLIKDKYYIQYIYNEDYGVFAKIYHLKSLAPLLKPNVSEQVGILTTYFEFSPNEGEYQHWIAECYLLKDHCKKNIIDLIGKELLERTVCREPLVLRVFKGDKICDDFRRYGQIYTPDFYNN